VELRDPDLNQAGRVFRGAGRKSVMRPTGTTGLETGGSAHRGRSRRSICRDPRRRPPERDRLVLHCFGLQDMLQPARGSQLPANGPNRQEGRRLSRTEIVDHHLRLLSLRVLGLASSESGHFLCKPTQLVGPLRSPRSARSRFPVDQRGQVFTWAVMDPQGRHRDRQRRQCSTLSATTSLPKPSNGR